MGDAEYFIEKQSEVGKNSVFPEVPTFFCVIRSEDRLLLSTNRIRQTIYGWDTYPFLH